MHVIITQFIRRILSRWFGLRGGGSAQDLD